MKAFYQVIAPDVTEADVAHAFELLDTASDGKIRWDEFTAAAGDFLFGAVEETEVSRIFFGPLLDYRS